MATSRRWNYFEYQGQVLLHRIRIFNTLCGVPVTRMMPVDRPLPSQREALKERCPMCARITRGRRD